MPDQSYFDTLSLFKPQLFYDHSPEYKNSDVLLQSLVKKELINSDKIFLKTPVSIRTNPLPSQIYDYTMGEIEALSIQRINSLFLNKISGESVERFIDSKYYYRLMDFNVIDSISLILSQNPCQKTMNIHEKISSPIKYTSVLSNIFEVKSQDFRKKSSSTKLIRSIFSSGLIPKFIKYCDTNLNTLDKDFGSFDDYKRRVSYLHLLNSHNLLTYETCVHFPLYLSRSNGIFLATTKSKHLESMYNHLTNHVAFIQANKYKLAKFKAICQENRFVIEY